MSIFNKRNAFVGWIVVKAGKIVARQKASQATHSARIGGVVAGALAAVGGLLVFWRKKRTGE